MHLVKVNGFIKPVAVGNGTHYFPAAGIWPSCVIKSRLSRKSLSSAIFPFCIRANVTPSILTCFPVRHSEKHVGIIARKIPMFYQFISLPEYIYDCEFNVGKTGEIICIVSSGAVYSNAVRICMILKLFAL